MKVRYEIFTATFKSWEKMHAEVSEFATGIGQDNLINITKSSDGGTGVITVWYWSY